MQIFSITDLMDATKATRVPVSTIFSDLADIFGKQNTALSNH